MANRYPYSSYQYSSGFYDAPFYQPQMQQQFSQQSLENQQFAPPPQILQGSQPVTCSSKNTSAERESSGKNRERWQFKDEQVLIQLWADNIEIIESKDSRKAWEKITSLLNEKQKLNKSVDQCQRKLKHLKNQYKEKRDWNRKQSGGNLKKSPHYDAIDAVLGCRDVITCNKVKQVGIGGSETTTTPVPASEEGPSTPTSAETSRSVSPESSQSSAETVRRKERKNRKQPARKRTRPDSDSEDDSAFRDAIKGLNSEGEVMGRTIEGMQAAQNQQLQLMTQLLGSFNRYMDAKTAKKD